MRFCNPGGVCAERLVGQATRASEHEQPLAQNMRKTSKATDHPRIRSGLNVVDKEPMACCLRWAAGSCDLSAALEPCVYACCVSEPGKSKGSQVVYVMV